MPTPDRPLALRAECLLQQAWRRDERRHEQHEKRNRGGAVPERAEALVRCGLHHGREAAGVRKCRRQHDGEPAQEDDELHQIHPRGSEQASRGKVRRHQPAADQAPGPLGKAGHHAQDPGDAYELAGEDRKGREPQHRRDQPAHGPAEVMLEQIARRQEPVRRGLSPDPRADPEREQQRPDGGRPVPPPGAQSVAVPEARGANRRAGPDVGGEHGREDEGRAQLAVRDEETRGTLNSAADGQAQQEQARRVADKKQEVQVHVSAAPPGGRGPRAARAVPSRHAPRAGRRRPQPPRPTRQSG